MCARCTVLHVPHVPQEQLEASKATAKSLEAKGRKQYKQMMDTKQQLLDLQEAQKQLQEQEQGQGATARLATPAAAAADAGARPAAVTFRGRGLARRHPDILLPAVEPPPPMRRQLS